MKKVIIIIVILMCLLSFCSCAANLTLQQEYDLLASDETPIELATASYIYNIYELENVVGYSDYVFVGKVKEYKRTIDETKSSLPQTVYAIEVIENIKGSLITETDIELIKHGGLSKNRKRKLFYVEDVIPMVGDYYVFSVFGIDEGQIKACGKNSNLKIENFQNYHEDEVYKQFITASENEVFYERRRWKSIYEME